MKVFKTVADFILCILTPFLWVIGISIGSVFALILFIWNIFYAIFLFFTGRSIFKNLEEDEKAREIKLLNKRRQEAVEAAAHAAASEPEAPLMSSTPKANPYMAHMDLPKINTEPVRDELPNEDMFITPDDIAYKNEADANKKEVNYDEIPF